MSHFVRQTAFDVEYAPTRIAKWRSARTGLQLTYINQPLPIVNGYFAVATEIQNDSGCPHTLEHLVFMGSQKYPYKGLLDILGNRFSSSTNAWTSVDQTVYTLSTAGWEGFRTLLPVYLDHLFHPTLTDDACLTEVYHIDGKGKERGVVFSEMQGIENQAWFITYSQLQKTLYAPASGYSSETGGLMAELRHLTNAQIRDFHKSMYRPDNLCVVVTGAVDEAELLQVMGDFDNGLDALPATPSKRPFVDLPPDLPLTESIVKRVEFPDEDESMAELVMGWIGPRSDWTLDNLAVDMIGSYLTDSPISLFNKHLVEVDEPLATDIVYGTDDFARTGLNFTVGGVPTERLDEATDLMKSLLEQETDEAKFDLEYMRQIVQQQKLKFIAQTEKDPSTFSNIVILDFIYGKVDGSELASYTKDLHDYETLANWSAKEWCSVLRKYFVDNSLATILGVPSSDFNKASKDANKERNRAIKAKYGPEGLQKLKDRLKEAQARNDRPIPEDVLLQFGKPDLSKIEFIKTSSYKAGSNDGTHARYETDDEFAQLIKADVASSNPLFLHFENYKSRFITTHVVMSSTSIPEELLKYLSVFEEIFTFSIKLPTGEYIPYDQVITDINEDLVEFLLDNGIDHKFNDLLSVKVTCEAPKYTKAIDWLVKVLKYSVFEESRIKIVVEKIVNSLADKKRNDELMMYSLQYRTVYSDRSIRKAQDSINTETFYKDLLAKINSGGFESVKADLEKFRLSLFNALNMKVFVVGGCSNVPKPVSAWANFTSEMESDNNTPPFSLEDIPRAFQFKTTVGEKCSNGAYLVTTPASESTHFMSLSPTPTDYLDEDIFKIALVSEFLGGVEGPFWRAIRGTGLAYGANIRQLIESGFLSFTVYRGADAKQSWEVGRKIIQDYVSGNQTISDVMIENSISAIVNELANAELNFYDTAINNITDNIFKKRGPEYVKHFLGKLYTYTSKDLIYVMKKYFLPLFSADLSLIFACVPTDKIDEFSQFLAEQKYVVTTEEIHALAGHDDCGSDCDDCQSDDGSDDDSDESGSDEDSEDSDSEASSDAD